MRRRLRSLTPAFQARNVIAAICGLGGLFVLLFWALYFTGSQSVHGEHALVTAYESAFPIADAFFVVALLAAMIGLSRARPYGVFALVAASAVSIYLGILDVTFYGAEGLYAPITGAVAFEIVVNAFSIGGGLLGIRYAWKFWRAPWAIPAS